MEISSVSVAAAAPLMVAMMLVSSVFAAAWSGSRQGVDVPANAPGDLDRAALLLEGGHGGHLVSLSVGSSPAELTYSTRQAAPHVGLET